MVKLKQTKLKHRKHKDNHEKQSNNKSNILTSKNKNRLVSKNGKYYRKNLSINKKNKRSRKQLQFRTLDVLKTYGSTFKNQDGGFIISYLKYKWNMRKIKKIIAKLGKNQKELNEYIHTYENQPETFKRLGDKKAAVIYDILRTEKDKTIIQFLLNNKEEKTYDTSNMEHDLELINTKIEIETANKLKLYNQEIAKEMPKLAKNLAKFKADSAKFRKINEDYSKLVTFYEEQRELSDKYHSIKDLEKLTSKDKEIKNKYLKNEEDIKYILSYKQEDINELNKNIKKIGTLMNMADDYDKKFKYMKEDNYTKDLEKWQENYKGIYVNITDIESGIKNISGTLEKIKEFIKKIAYYLQSIYGAFKENRKLNPILKIEEILDENLGYLKNIKNTSIKKIKDSFIKQIPIEQIEFYLPLAAASLIQTEKGMNDLHDSLVLDKEYISKGTYSGGGRWDNIMIEDGMDGMDGMGIGELKWFGKGGADVISYEVLLKLNIDTFLDTDYRDIFETLKQINEEIIDTNSYIYKLKNYEFLNIMKIYFNIYVFFVYYLKSRIDDSLNPDNNNTPNENNYKNNGCISKLLSIISKYEIIIKDNKDSKFKELPNTVKKEIQKYISELKMYLFNNTIGTGFLNDINTNIKTIFFDKVDKDKNIWNPFKENDKHTLKNLYYEYNPHSSNVNNDLDCIKSFIGYYNKKDTNITNYENKAESELNKNNLFTQGALHNKYDDIPVIYKYNDGSGTNEYKFIVIYDNKIMKKNHPSIKIKVFDNSGEIDEKFDKFIDFLKLPNQLNRQQQNQLSQLKTDIYNSTKHITDDFDKLFCNFDSNALFENIINNEIKEYPYLSKICDDTEKSYIWSISYMKNCIINPWNASNFVDKNTNDMQTIWNQTQVGIDQNDKTETAATTAATNMTNAGANPNNPVATSLNQNFRVFYNNAYEWLKKNIIPLILRNIYNNVKYDAPIQYYTVDRNTHFMNINKTDISNPKLLNILNQKDQNNNNNYYIILYVFDNTNDKNIIKKEIIDDNNEKMQKYLFTWLKSEANNDDMKPKTDNVSNFIYKLYDNTSKKKTLLSDLNISNIETNEFCNAFNKDEKKIFIEAYTSEFDTLKLAIIKYPVVLKEDKVVNTLSNPILPRTENRLVFDLPQSDKFNEENNYNSNNFTKQIVSDIITKSYNKKGDYKNIPIQYVKRIVSFNVHNWNRSIDTINDIKPKPDPPTLLLTDPKNAINFIKTKLPDTDVLGFLNYSLYPNDASANRHIKSKVAPPHEGTITVDNKYTEKHIENELKLDNYFIKNDNYDNVVTMPLLKDNDNMFLGKALYYNDKKTTISKPQPLCGDTTKANDILYTEIIINKNPIGLYLVNIYIPLNNINDLDTLIKKCINAHTKSHTLYETVIMGTFLLDGAYTKEQLIADMKTFSYNQFGKIKDTSINTDSIDLCFISDEFANHFTILNDEIVVPSGSVSSHYPIYLDIIENDNMNIEVDDFIIIYSNEHIEIIDKKQQIKFKLTLKKGPIVAVGGASKSVSTIKKTKPKAIQLDSKNLYDIEVFDLNGNSLTDDKYKSVSIDKTNTNIIHIKDKDGKIRMSIDKDIKKITRFNEDNTINSTTEIDKDGILITKDKDGIIISKTIDDVNGNPVTTDSSTGEVIKSQYAEDEADLEKAQKAGKRLLSKFVDYANTENIKMLKKDNEIIVGHIKKIIDLIKNDLKPKKFEVIKSKLDGLAKNIIELKLIEPKLKPDKVLIEQYGQKDRNYDWVEDVTKRDQISMSLQDEAKELEAILKKHPEIKDILPSSGERLTKENILEIIGSLDLSKNKILNKTFLEKFQNKLKQPENAKILLNYLDETYPTKEQYLTKCVILINVNIYAPLKLYGEKIQLLDCNNVITTHFKDKTDKYKK